MSNVIAIDGPAASGKSTIAKRLAERFRIAYVNTGSLYRAVALAAVRAGVKLDSLTPAFLSTLKLEYCRDDSGRYELKLNGEFPGAALRAPEIADGASLVATQPAVRNYLLDVQRSFAGARRIVMEGRDIGTVIFPNAEFKFFLGFATVTGGLTDAIFIYPSDGIYIISNKISWLLYTILLTNSTFILKACHLQVF